MTGALPVVHVMTVTVTVMTVVTVPCRSGVWRAEQERFAEGRGRPELGLWGVGVRGVLGVLLALVGVHLVRARRREPDTHDQERGP